MTFIRPTAPHIGGSSGSAPAQERGAALLTVLLLVAVMAVAVSATLERLTIATRLTGTAAGLDRIRLAALGLEQLTLARVDAEWRQLQKGGGPQKWADRPIAIPLPGGARGLVTARDGGNCFNLNSLVRPTAIAENAPPTGPLVARPVAADQMAGLLMAFAVTPAEARRIAAAATDWMDADSLPLDGGAERDARNRPVPNRPMLDISELVDVPGMNRAIFGRISPYLCALPDHDLSALNIESLRPDQAPLLAMLLPASLDLPQARKLLSARPSGGYGSVANFWSQPLLSAFRPDPDVAAQLRVVTRYIRLESRVTMANMVMNAQTLIDTKPIPARVISRNWAMAEGGAS